VVAEENMALQAHQERVVAEKSELTEKLHRLESFVDGAVYASLPDAERTRLSRQLLIMKLYEQVLSERIGAF
jgi:hypothetical protein